MDRKKTAIHLKASSSLLYERLKIDVNKNKALALPLSFKALNNGAHSGRRAIV